MKARLARFFKGPEDIMYQAIVFLVIFVAAKFGQYIFYEWNTAPAVFWPPTGIALAVVYIWGYRYAPVIFLSLFLATVSGPLGYLWPGSILTPFGQVISAVLGVYLLHLYRYNSNQSNVTNIVYFLLIIVVVSSISPTINTFVSYITGTLVVPLNISWSRIWAGYMLSSLIIFPLITSWIPYKKLTKFNFLRVFEWCIVVGLLIVSLYNIFWTGVEDESMYFFSTLILISLFWSCLRFSTRTVNLFITFGTVLGIAGLILFPESDVLLSLRLFTTELFLLLTIPIFYMFSAVVQDSVDTISVLDTAKNIIEKENSAKNEFIAVLAHELRNPLAPLKTTLEILELETLSSEVKTHVQNAHRQVHIMQRLLDDLLDVTRMSHGKFELKITSVNLCTALAHCVESTKDICQKRQLRVVMDKICDDTIWLDVDSVRFEQVLVNIINNAAKYTNIGGEINIRHFVKGTKAVLEIQDTGIGINPENLNSIFDSFWQVKKIVPESSGGIGVGLSLTKQIVEMHGGTITAKSDGIDKGSTFIVTLPLSTRNVPMQPSFEMPGNTLQRSLRILVADDNVAAANALCKLLSLKNHIAKSVYTGSHALSETTQFKPDCVILDIGLPDVDGYQVALQLRQAGYQNKIIALTGYGQKEDIEKALANGFDFFIIKPVGLKQLEDYFITITL